MSILDYNRVLVYFSIAASIILVLFQALELLLKCYEMFCKADMAFTKNPRNARVKHLSFRPTTDTSSALTFVSSLICSRSRQSIQQRRDTWLNLFQFQLQLNPNSVLQFGPVLTPGEPLSRGDLAVWNVLAMRFISKAGPVDQRTRTDFSLAGK